MSRHKKHGRLAGKGRAMMTGLKKPKKKMPAGTAFWNMESNTPIWPVL
jgi:hypothetical protein